MADAACKGMDADVFFPADNRDVPAALAVCRGCPVCADCLAYSFRAGEWTGVWGGMDARGRRQLARRLRAAGDVRFRTLAAAMAIEDAS